MQTLTDFIRSARITMTADRADDNPHMQDSHEMDHWRCILRANGDQRRRLTVPFSMGRGHNGAAPELADVLDCLASDSAGLENARDFEDWCGEYGYDTDSRKAERTYRTVQRQAKKLRAFLGDDAYKALLWETERE
jgi:hypothetical protein